jgi:hypothetical protein
MKDVFIKNRIKKNMKILNILKLDFTLNKGLGNL